MFPFLSKRIEESINTYVILEMGTLIFIKLDEVVNSFHMFPKLAKHYLFTSDAIRQNQKYHEMSVQAHMSIGNTCFWVFKSWALHETTNV
jgi:hypothetical protein